MRFRSFRPVLRAVPVLWMAAACTTDVSSPPGIPPPVAVTALLDPAPELAYVGNTGAPSVAIVDVRSMTQVGEIALDGHAMAPNVAVAPGGRFLYVVTQSPPTVQKVDLGTGLPVDSAMLELGSEPLDIAVTPSGHRIFVTHFSGHYVSAIDAATLTVLAVIPLTDARDWVNGIAMGPGGQHLFVSSQVSGRVHVIDVGLLAVVATIETGATTLNELALTQDGRFILGTRALGSEVIAIDAESFSVTATIPTGPNPVGIAIPPSGTEAYVVHNPASLLSVIDTRTLAVTATIALPAAGRRIGVSTSGRLAMATLNNGGGATLVDVVGRTVLGSVAVAANPWGVAILNGVSRFQDNSSLAGPYAAVVGRSGYRALEGSATLPLASLPGAQIVGTAVDVGLACNGMALTNDPAGKIALIKRGTCTFTDKITNVRAAGAVAAVVYNNLGGDALFRMLTAPLDIPGVFVARSSGLALVAGSPLLVRVLNCGSITANCRGAL